MEKLSAFLVKRKFAVIIIFTAITVLCALAVPLGSVNYSLVDYLPESAQSTTAIGVMKSEFGGAVPNASVMISDVTIKEALEYKSRLAAVEGVDSVSWLDDAVGEDVLLSTPVEFLDPGATRSYYKDGSALFSLTIASGMEQSAVHAVREIIGVDNAVAGDAVNIAAAQDMSVSEVLKAFYILLPLVLLVLILTTTSWIEPLLYLITIGFAVAVNMGTTALLGETSFMTQSISPILQLAVSLDYAIFLLHCFREYREEYEPGRAMVLAVKKSLAAVAASAATTVLGFLALIFMRFRIGPDLGLNLAKGVVLSFLFVMVFMPALTLASVKLLDRTAHRRFIPELRGVGRKLVRISVPLLIAAAVIAVPCYLAQSNAQFMYGMGAVAGSSRAGQDALKIEEEFGKENLLALLVPRGQTGKESELSKTLHDMDDVRRVVSYVDLVGEEIPPDYLDRATLGRFYSDNYALFIIYTDTTEESDGAFRAVEDIRSAAAMYYDGVYLAGQSATLYDIRNTVSADTKIVNLCAVIGIFLTILVTFRSVSIPLLLLFTIETAIWLNLSIGYFTGNTYNYIGYLIIGTVQLGSTVDYAILLTDRYLDLRREHPKKEAAIRALGGNLLSILTSAAILSMAGFTLSMTSTNPIVAELGELLGRGTLLSLAMVCLVLPALLTVFDGLIQKTTLNHGFGKGRKSP